MTDQELNELSKLPFMTLEEEERETHIYISYRGKEAKIETTDRFMMAKLDKLCEKKPENWKLEEVQTVLYQKDDGSKERRITGKYYSCSIDCINIRAGKREMSEEQRQELAERMAKLREKA